MKYSAIEQMYYGDRGKGELLEASQEYKLCYNSFCTLHDKFMEKIKDDLELRDMFNDLLNALQEAHAVDAKDSYAAGFRFGALMQMDILRGD